MRPGLCHSSPVVLSTFDPGEHFRSPSLASAGEVGVGGGEVVFC